MSHYTGDVSLYTLDGTSVLATYENVTLEVTEDQVDGSSIGRMGKTAQGVKLSGRIDTSLMSTFSTPDRVSHLDLSAMALGATSYLASLRRLRLSGSYEQKMRAGVGALNVRPQNVKKDYAASAEFDADDTVASAIMIAMASPTYANRNAVLGFTLNSIAYTFPMRMQKAGVRVQRDDLQLVTLDLAGRSPDSGAYPTAPVGTTSLLEKAINVPETAIAFAFTSKAAGGVAMSGSCIFSSFDIEINDGELVRSQYSFNTTGAWTVAATA
jgi:hypothetical protein